MDEQIIREIERIVPSVRDEDLSRHCSWRIGGRADLFAVPGEAGQVEAVRDFCCREGVPLVVIGQGSNLLFDDEGVRGVVMKIGSRCGACVIDGETVRVQAGAWGPGVVRQTGSRGLSGLEHLIGVPGCLGGLVFMNAGSLRRCIGESVVSVKALDPTGQIQEVSQKDCGFSYRSSVFQSGGWIILSAVLRLVQSDRLGVLAEMAAVLADRKRKFPLRWPTCGSVFSNDTGLFERFGPPGKVIDRMGLKGTAVGSMAVSAEHGNFIINRGGGTCAQAVALIGLLRRRVFARTGIWMNTEVRYVSPAGLVFPALSLIHI